MTRGYRPPLPILERLEGKTQRDGACWRWTGAHDSDGYGRIRLGSRLDGSRRLDAVHRVSYEHFQGPIPTDREIDHSYEAGCRFRDCWNPAHLRVLTHQQNTQAVSPIEQARRVVHMRDVVQPLGASAVRKA